MTDEKQERVILLEAAITALTNALKYEQSNYPPLFAKGHTDGAEMLIASWKNLHGFAKLDGKWI
jgi:hypothetical protein